MWNNYNAFDSYYGNFRTRTFSDIFPDVETFLEEYKESPLYNMSDDYINKIYYLLYAKYGNSHIANSDENQFKFKVFYLLFAEGPTWQRKLELQKQIREMDIEEAIKGSKAIHNHSFNPSTEPSTESLEELTTINEQNTSHYKKSKVEGYALLLTLMSDDVTTDFLNRFKRLFIQVIQPAEALWYATDITDTTEDL